MNAKDFLLQIKKLDRLIENKLAELQQWWDISTNITANMSGERVETSFNPRSKEAAICEWADLKSEIKTEIKKLETKKQQIISVIEQLNATEYDVLHKIYVQGFTLQEVASHYDRRYEWATTVQGRALKHVQIILNKRSYGE